MTRLCRYAGEGIVLKDDGFNSRRFHIAGGSPLAREPGDE